jgi:hypothetical protein
MHSPSHIYQFYFQSITHAYDYSNTHKAYIKHKYIHKSTDTKKKTQQPRIVGRLAL